MTAVATPAISARPMKTGKLRTRRRRILVNLGLVFGFLALVLVFLAVLAKRVPSFYAQSDRPEGPDRQRDSAAATGEYSKILLAVTNDDQQWDFKLSAERLNAYFQQDYFQHGGDENLPNGLSAPRVKFEGGRLRLGVRYGKGLFSTVLSMEVKLWLVPGQSNVIAMEIVRLRAGSLPLSPGLLMDDISEAARREKIETTWYRHEGNPVAVMRFQSDLTRPTLQFKELELSEGTLILKGESALRPAPGRDR